MHTKVSANWSKTYIFRKASYYLLYFRGPLLFYTGTKIQIFTIGGQWTPPFCPGTIIWAGRSLIFFLISRTTDGKTKTHINYIFFKNDKIWKHVSDKCDSRQIALAKSTRAILRLPFPKCTFECFYCFRFLYLIVEQIKIFASHRYIHYPCRRNLTKAHQSLKHDGHCNLVCFSC